MNNCTNKHFRQYNIPEYHSFSNSENSFDFIRYYLAFTVMAAHYAVLSGTYDFNLRPNSGEAVCAFFSISGFFVYNSYLRNPNPKAFIRNRLLRILPPYVFIVLLCTVNGVFMTNKTAIDYFTSPQLYKYLISNLCFLNFIEPTLPGVFSDHLVQAVNGALWTMKVEIMLYATVPLTYPLFRQFNKGAVLLGIFVISYLYKMLFNALYQDSGLALYLMLERQVGGQLIYFYAGTAVMMYFRTIEQYMKWLFPAACLMYICQNCHLALNYLSPLCLTIILTGLAFHTKFLNCFSRIPNLSYGIYLFHCPIIQTAVHFGLPQHNPWMAAICILATTSLLAYISYRYIEKPLYGRFHIR